MTSVMSARSPLSISKCRESVWPEAAKRKGPVSGHGEGEGGTQVKHKGLQGGDYGKTWGRLKSGGQEATNQDLKFPFSSPCSTPNPNPIQEGSGTSLQGLVWQEEGAAA